MQKSQQMGTKPLFPLLMQFSIPSIIGMLVSALYNIVDRIFVGRGVGDMALAGLTICGPIMNVLLACNLLVSVGSGALASIRLGEGKREDAERVLGNAIALNVFLNLILTLCIFLFQAPLLRLFGASEVVMPYAESYMSIIALGVVMQGVGMLLSNFMRVEGSPTLSMMTMLIGAISNTILDYLFVIVFKWGVVGAAVATVIGQGLGFVWTLYYYLTGRSQIKFRLPNLRLSPALALKIMSMGSSNFSIQFVSSIINVIYNNSLRFYGGDIAITAFGIMMSVSQMAFMPMLGINQGAQPIMGFNFGARNYRRVRGMLLLAIACSTLILVIGFLAVQLFPEAIITLFGSSDPQLMTIGISGLRMLFLFYPLLGMQVIGGNYFQATGRPRMSLLLSLTRQVLLLIPALVVFPLFWGLNGIFFAQPFSDIVSIVLTATILFRELRKLNVLAVESEGDALELSKQPS